MAKKPKPPRPPKPVPPPPDPPVGAATGVCFVWDAVAGATDYKLQIGSVSLGADLYNAFVGNALTAYVPVTPGLRFCRVVAYQGATRLSTSPQQQMVIL